MPLRNVDVINCGTADAANSLPATLSNEDKALLAGVGTSSTAIGTKTDAPATDGTATSRSLIALVKGIFTSILSVIFSGAVRSSVRVIKVAAADLTRPADTIPYAVGDAITISTSAPGAPVGVDLSAYVAVGGAIKITGMQVLADNAAAQAIDVYVAPETFTLTNDNTPIGISIADLKKMGRWFSCDEVRQLAATTVCSSAEQKEVVLTAQSLFYALRAAAGQTPTSGGKYTVQFTFEVLP